MTNYRRIYTPGATWFFTVNIAKRRNSRLLVENIDVLRTAFYVLKRNTLFALKRRLSCPTTFIAWTLPPGDANYSMRCRQVKGRFSSRIDTGESLSKSRKERRERGLRQRRFWTHLITDQDDFNRHVDYLHWNPVKHGWVCQVADWPHSSFFKFVKMGVYPMTWGHSGEFDFDAGE